ncbi:MAG: hypothetical protein SXA11_14770 [Cyanobacteriota bacterium]|nr:hypothetical protein [Cyanobacteriota bacterium]
MPANRLLYFSTRIKRSLTTVEQASCLFVGILARTGSHEQARRLFYGFCSLTNCPTAATTPNRDTPSTVTFSTRQRLPPTKVVGKF